MRLGGRRPFATAPPPRVWFYYLNDRGCLYNVSEPDDLLSRRKVPRGPTYIRDGRFLNFFFTRLRPNHTGAWADFPYISPCGPELNYIRPADKPIVFSALVTKPDGATVLTYAHDLAVPFDPTQLHTNGEGRFYYPIEVCGMGLIHTQLAVELGDNISSDAGGRHALRWRGRTFPIRTYDWSPGLLADLADFPYISPCGPELNYIRPADKPIVFSALVTKPDGATVLTYAHDLAVPFDPTQLHTNGEGRFYYPIEVCGMGLIHTQLAVELGDNISCDAAGRHALQWRGRTFPIRTYDWSPDLLGD